MKLSSYCCYLSNEMRPVNVNGLSRTTPKYLPSFLVNTWWHKIYHIAIVCEKSKLCFIRITGKKLVFCNQEPPILCLPIPSAGFADVIGPCFVECIFCIKEKYQRDFLIEYRVFSFLQNLSGVPSPLSLSCMVPMQQTLHE